jgi:hypothetical protein
VISDSTEHLEVVVDAALNGFGIDRLTAFNESCLLVQDLPDDAAEPVRNGPDAFSESQTHDKAPEYTLQVASFRLHGRLCSLAEYTAQETIAFGELPEWFWPALWLLPGQTPIQEASWAAEGKAAAGPISAIISCAASAPIPGSSMSRITVS